MEHEHKFNVIGKNIFGLDVFECAECGARYVERIFDIVEEEEEDDDQT